MIETELPEPQQDARAHSLRVKHSIGSAIEKDGPLTFAEYMQMALYAPGLGYYMSGNQKFGAAGDFVTAPETSKLFGCCVATQILQVLQQTGGDILELGAGTGRLCASILQTLSATDSVPPQYLILEPSAELSLRQQILLEATLSAELFSCCKWVTTLPDSFVGVIVANEVVDAMPVERFVVGADALQQVYVDQSDDGLRLTLQPATESVVSPVATIGNYLPEALPPGYCSEINLLVAPWINAIAHSLSRGLLLLIDYGYPQKEYYLAERTTGTLRCFYQHLVHHDALKFPGLQDITADVDFTLIAMAATSAGLDLHGYTSQAQFLLGCGLIEHATAAAAATGKERYLLAQQVKTLSMASAMGERFQVMGLSKDLNLELSGFSRFDLSHRL